MHAWTSPCNPDPLKPGVKLMAGCNSAGVGVTSVTSVLCVHIFKEENDKILLKIIYQQIFSKII